MEVAAILALPSGCGFTEEDVQRVVANCPKQRFSLSQDSGRLKIRANQGHSMEVCITSAIQTFLFTCAINE